MTVAWRAWSKLSPKTADLSGMPAGGEPELPPEVVAAALAKLPRRYYLAGRVRYLKDWSVSEELATLLWIRCCTYASRENWQVPKGKQYVRRLARIAVAELADPREFKRVSVRQEASGIPRATWYRTWQGRYQTVYEELHRWSDIAALHLSRHLRSGD